mgnify:CR=1 FL=1
MYGKIRIYTAWDGIDIDANNEVSVAMEPTVEGYTFSGWTTTDVTINNGKFIMPNNNVTFTALTGSFVNGIWTAKLFFSNPSTSSFFILLYILPHF